MIERTGMVTFSETRPSVILGGLSEALLVAARYPETRPLSQYFPPQWALTNEMIVAPEEGWKIRHDAFNRNELHYRQRLVDELDEGAFKAAVEAPERVSPSPLEQVRYGFHTDGNA